MIPNAMKLLKSPYIFNGTGDVSAKICMKVRSFIHTTLLRTMWGLSFPLGGTRERERETYL